MSLEMIFFMVSLFYSTWASALTSSFTARFRKFLAMIFTVLLLVADETFVSFRMVWKRTNMLLVRAISWPRCSSFSHSFWLELFELRSILNSEILVFSLSRKGRCSYLMS